MSNYIGLYKYANKHDLICTTRKDDFEKLQKRKRSQRFDLKRETFVLAPPTPIDEKKRNKKLVARRLSRKWRKKITRKVAVEKPKPTPFVVGKVRHKMHSPPFLHQPVELDKKKNTPLQSFAPQNYKFKAPKGLKLPMLSPRRATPKKITLRTVTLPRSKIPVLASRIGTPNKPSPFSLRSLNIKGSKTITSKKPSPFSLKSVNVKGSKTIKKEENAYSFVTVRSRSVKKKLHYSPQKPVAKGQDVAEEPSTLDETEESIVFGRLNIAKRQQLKKNAQTYLIREEESEITLEQVQITQSTCKTGDLSNSIEKKVAVASNDKNLSCVSNKQSSFFKPFCPKFSLTSENLQKILDQGEVNINSKEYAGHMERSLSKLEIHHTNVVDNTEMCDKLICEVKKNTYEVLNNVQNTEITTLVEQVSLVLNENNDVFSEENSIPKKSTEIESNHLVESSLVKSFHDSITQGSFSNHEKQHKKSVCVELSNESTCAVLDSSNKMSNSLNINRVSLVSHESDDVFEIQVNETFTKTNTEIESDRFEDSLSNSQSSNTSMTQDSLNHPNSEKQHNKSTCSELSNGSTCAVLTSLIKASNNQESDDRRDVDNDKVHLLSSEDNEVLENQKSANLSKENMEVEDNQLEDSLVCSKTLHSSIAKDSFDCSQNHCNISTGAELLNGSTLAVFTPLLEASTNSEIDECKNRNVDQMPSNERNNALKNHESANLSKESMEVEGKLLDDSSISSESVWNSISKDSFEYSDDQHNKSTCAESSNKSNCSVLNASDKSANNPEINESRKSIDEMDSVSNESSGIIQNQNEDASSVERSEEKDHLSDSSSKLQAKSPNNSITGEGLDNSNNQSNESSIMEALNESVYKVFSSLFNMSGKSNVRNSSSLSSQINGSMQQELQEGEKKVPSENKVSSNDEESKNSSAEINSPVSESNDAEESQVVSVSLLENGNIVFEKDRSIKVRQLEVQAEDNADEELASVTSECKSANSVECQFDTTDLAVVETLSSPFNYSSVNQDISRSPITNEDLDVSLKRMIAEVGEKELVEKSNEETSSSRSSPLSNDLCDPIVNSTYVIQRKISDSVESVQKQISVEVVYRKRSDSVDIIQRKSSDSVDIIQRKSSDSVDIIQRKSSDSVESAQIQDSNSPAVPALRFSLLSETGSQSEAETNISEKNKEQDHVESISEPLSNNMIEANNSEELIKQNNTEVLIEENTVNVEEMPSIAICKNSPEVIDLLDSPEITKTSFSKSKSLLDKFRYSMSATAKGIEAVTSQTAPLNKPKLVFDILDSPVNTTNYEEPEISSGDYKSPTDFPKRNRSYSNSLNVEKDKDKDVILLSDSDDEDFETMLIRIRQKHALQKIDSPNLTPKLPPKLSPRLSPKNLIKSPVENIPESCMSPTKDPPIDFLIKITSPVATVESPSTRIHYLRSGAKAVSPSPQKNISKNLFKTPKKNLLAPPTFDSPLKDDLLDSPARVLQLRNRLVIETPSPQKPKSKKKNKTSQKENGVESILATECVRSNSPMYIQDVNEIPPVTPTPKKRGRPKKTALAVDKLLQPEDCAGRKSPLPDSIASPMRVLSLRTRQISVSPSPQKVTPRGRRKGGNRI